jgi:hypothetical protein
MSLRILTWNVSFGAMTGSDLDKTSLPLPAKCREKGEFLYNGSNYTQCLINVVNTIDSQNYSYDFIALQEASNWNIIFSKSIKLQKMGSYVHHLADLEDMVTFYDNNKYTLMAVKVGNLLPGNGRPYQILFLQNNEDKSYYIFINLHNGHKISKEQLEISLSNNINIGFIPSKCNIQIDLVKQSDVDRDISDIINDKNFKVIMAGDYNDHGKYNYWRNLHPFSKTIFQNLKKINVKANALPPLTCCAPINLFLNKELNYDGKKRNIRKDRYRYDTMFGDYILVNENLSVVVDNRVLLNFNYDGNTFPTSDHLPVEIVLSAEYSSSNYKEKYLKYKKKYIYLKKYYN